MQPNTLLVQSRLGLLVSVITVSSFSCVGTVSASCLVFHVLGPGLTFYAFTAYHLSRPYTPGAQARWRIMYLGVTTFVIDGTGRSSLAICTIVLVMFLHGSLGRIRKA